MTPGNPANFIALKGAFVVALSGYKRGKICTAGTQGLSVRMRQIIQYDVLVCRYVVDVIR